MTARPSPDPDAALYTTSEVAALLNVDIKTPRRWEEDGKVPEGVILRTPGRHRRWNGDWVRSLLAGGAR